MHDPYALRCAVKPAHGNACWSNLYKSLVKASLELPPLMQRPPLQRHDIYCEEGRLR
jgi:hypothetical protein